MALTGLSRHFQRKLAQINRMPWLLATSEDLRYPATIARPPMRVAGAVRWYVDRLVMAAPRNLAVGEALIKVINLIDPYALVRPSILVRVLTDAFNIFSSDPNLSISRAIVLRSEHARDQVDRGRHA